MTLIDHRLRICVSPGCIAFVFSFWTELKLPDWRRPGRIRLTSSQAHWRDTTRHEGVKSNRENLFVSFSPLGRTRWEDACSTSSSSKTSSLFTLIKSETTRCYHRWPDLSSRIGSDLAASLTTMFLISSQQRDGMFTSFEKGRITN